jgi:hypothetical protein
MGATVLDIARRHEAVDLGRLGRCAHRAVLRDDVA